MATLNFYCRPSKQDKKGYSPIEVSIIINGNRTFYALPRKEKPCDFAKAVESKRGNDIKDYLDVMRAVINKAMTAIARDGKSLTTQNLKEYLKSGGIKAYTIEMLFDEHYAIIFPTLTTLNQLKYTRVRDDFYTQIDRDKDVDTISNAVIQSFSTFLSTHYSASTAAHKMAILKRTIKFALANHKMDIDPFNGVKISCPRGKVEYLTTDEVKVIQKKDLHCVRLEQVRDLFLFQTGSGLSYSDMVGLTKRDIQQDEDTYYIRKNRHKTDIEYTAILLPIAVDVLRKYDWTLPIISNQKMNSYLKEIQMLCGLEKSLHSHLARKTYCTYLLNNGVRMDIVSKCAGHSNTRITATIYAHLQTHTILKEVASAINTQKT